MSPILALLVVPAASSPRQDSEELRTRYQGFLDAVNQNRAAIRSFLTDRYYMESPDGKRLTRDAYLTAVNDLQTLIFSPKSTVELSAFRFTGDGASCRVSERATCLIEDESRAPRTVVTRSKARVYWRKVAGEWKIASIVLDETSSYLDGKLLASQRRG